MRTSRSHQCPLTEPGPDAELIERAQAVLEANWLGHATSPSPRLYPHQWSWDAACIAMGYASWNQTRAEQELRSLFSGQWRNGMLPHIVFTDDGRYFPGPDFWETDRSPDAPERPRTSGIVQPPIHATAAWQVYLRGDDRRRAAAFLEELFPRLEAWHGYLYRERCRNGNGLAEIWHPWESGMDNSPLWDEALQRMSLEPRASRSTSASTCGSRTRPSALRCGVRPVCLSRSGCSASSPTSPRGFVRLRRSHCSRSSSTRSSSARTKTGRDRACARVGRGAVRDVGTGTGSGLESLWDEEQALYVDYDVIADKPVSVATAAGLAPLYAGVPTGSRAERMVERLAASRVPVGDSGWAVTSLSPADPGFQPTRYWRGPVWPILNWVLQRGLERYGYRDRAEQVRQAVVELGRNAGFWEHYDPLTGRGHGGEQFAWTAALVLDLLHTDGSTARAGERGH